MQFGFVSAILADRSFEQVIDFAADNGFSCVELACWPRGRAERRYAGVTHLDVDTLDDEKEAYIRQYCEKRGVALSALAYYPNTLDPDPERRAAHAAHLVKLLRAAAKLGVGTVTSFIGRVPHLSAEDNLPVFRKVWEPLLRAAEELGVRFAIENCPMLFTWDEWPGGQNLFTSPELWERMFEMLPSPAFGINFDPSHFVWQQMDYIRAIYEFRERIYHVHFKDIKLYPEKLGRAGVLAPPLAYMSPKIPGLGDVDWGRYVSALTDIGYRGPACIEIEDKAFEGAPERVDEALILSRRYLSQFVI